VTGSDKPSKNRILIPGAFPSASSRREAPLRARVLATTFTQATMIVILAALYLARRPSELEPMRFFVYYAPRAVYALPFVVLIPLTLWTRQRWLLAECVLGAGLVFGPLMDLHLNTGSKAVQASQAAEDQMIRIVTFNIGTSSTFDIDGLADYLKREKIDILLVQEDAELTRFCRKMTQDLGWHSNKHNTIFSRWPILADSPDLPHEVGGDYLYQAEVQFVRMKRGDQEFLIGSAHAPSVRANFYSFLHDFDQEELRKVMDWQTRQIERIALSMDRSGKLPIILGGDFNTPPRSPHVRPLEKRFMDVFAAIGFGYGYTYPAATPWLRLDRFYVSRDWIPLKCHVAPRFGSDHRPLYVELVLDGSASGTSDTVSTGSSAPANGTAIGSSAHIAKSQPR
jgi:endonuclease/exonuclease/phosphatase (EEP) superfamily protein YafD